MYCGNCGTFIEEGNAFCLACGAPVVHVAGGGAPGAPNYAPGYAPGYVPVAGQPMGQPMGQGPLASTLTSGEKLGYAALGFFLGVIGVLVAWLASKDTPKSSETIKFSIIGLAVSFGLGIVVFIIYMVFMLVLGFSLMGMADGMASSTLETLDLAY
ncbi:MAG: hypothetical protein LBB42_05315 [Coriobacteriales bacterium]|jgi:hypothetical protein|nr:hypothetical protein [Coriobacteriales bacterium]